MTMASDNEKSNADKKHTSVVDRYFRKRYKADVRKKRGEDQCVLVHSNRICVVTVAPEHPILSEKKTVTKVDFQVDKKTDRMQNKVTGKHKRGAQWLTELSSLCHVHCTDGSTYTLCSCVKGNLVEVNENLLADPQLLTRKPQTDGYLAMVLTKLGDHDREMSKLLSTEEYEKRVEKRRISLLVRDKKQEDAKSEKESVEEAPESLNMTESKCDLDTCAEPSTGNESTSEHHAELKDRDLNDVNCANKTTRDTVCVQSRSETLMDTSTEYSQVENTKEDKRQKLEDVNGELLANSEKG